MKKLNLKELELRLPKIDENYSKILIGGDSYGEDYGDRNELNSGPTGPLYDPTEVEPVPWEPMSWDVDTSLDGMAEQDDQNDIGGPHGPGSGTNIPPYQGGDFRNNLPGPCKDGVDIIDYLIDGGMELGDFNTKFIEQFYTILETNSVIADALNAIDNAGIDLNFHIGQIINNNPGESTNAHTVGDWSPGGNSVDITFNVDKMNPDDGWTDDSNNPNETLSLVETILHEILHAKHTALAMEMRNQLIANNNFTMTSWYYQMTNQQSNQFAEMFVHFDAPNNQYSYVTDTQTRNDLEHAYINANENQLLEDAKTELTADIAVLEQYVQNLEAQIQQAEANLGTGVDPEGGGIGPTDADLQRIYNNLVSELWDIMQNYGWLFDI